MLAIRGLTPLSMLSPFCLRGRVPAHGNPDRGHESSVAFWRLSHAFFVGAEYAFAVFVAALSLVVFAGFTLPRWLAWSGVVIAVLLLVVPLGWIALLFLVPLWLIAVSVTLFRRERDGYSGTTSHRAQADA